jgi:hypothetical protein
MSDDERRLDWLQLKGAVITNLAEFGVQVVTQDWYATGIDLRDAIDKASGLQGDTARISTEPVADPDAAGVHPSMESAPASPPRPPLTDPREERE